MADSTREKEMLRNYAVASRIYMAGKSCRKIGGGPRRQSWLMIDSYIGLGCLSASAHG
jgi:hypothetical protein